MSHAGTIAALWRYPVKSTAGEPLAAARLAPDRGVVGDRAWALVDVETGHVASAKQPRKWAALLAWQARLADGGVVLTLPDGATVSSAQPDADARLSAALGRAVRLVDEPPRQAAIEEAKGDDAGDTPLALAAPAGTFFDFAPIHLVTTASLAHLQALAPASRFEPARFRPNLVIDTDVASGFVEDAWVGHALAVGDSVRLLVVSTTPRCVMTTLAQDELPADQAVLKALATHNPRLFELLGKKLPSVGVYAAVLEAGEVRPGDRVRLLGKERLRRAGTLLRAVKRAISR